MRQRVGVAIAVVGVLLAVGALAWGLGYVELPGEDRHDAAVVTVTDARGTTLATIDARVADTRAERIRGLSETETLSNGSGMLFVHPETGTHAYVMRGMAFPLDIVFVAPCDDCPAGVDGTVTSIHHADVPPAGARSPRYEGHGKWVVEVPQGYAEAQGIEVGDRVSIRYANATDDATGD